jgi:hypothetical protein
VPRRVRARLGAAVIAISAAVTLAACGDSATSTSTGSTSGGAGGCATAATSCPVAGPTPPAANPQGCTNPGSGRTDDFHQAVALSKLPDGLQVGDIKVGTGPAVKQGQTLAVAYSGWLQDGTLFDSSRMPGRQPFPLTLGAHGAIAGFEEALATMNVGGIRRAVIPPQLGYGATANGPIPANSTLIFDLEVLCAA